MNFFTQLIAFYEVIVVDLRLKHFHISLYMAILYIWNKNRMSNIIILQRDIALSYSKIGSNHTYYAGLKNLHEWGYIEYFPRQFGEKYTKIRLIIFEFSETDFKELDEKYGAFMHQYSADMHSYDADMHRLLHQYGALMHSISADMHPYSAYLHQRECISASLYKVLKFIKEKESIVKNNMYNPTQKNLFNSFDDISESKIDELQKQNFIKPTSENVIAFFISLSSEKSSAEKFYNYYASTGWRNKNNIPIVDWQSAAKNWILNDKSNQSNKTKNYDEAF